MGLFEALPRQALVYLLQRAVIDLHLRFYVRLLPRHETGDGVDPLTSGLSLGRQYHDAVEQDWGRAVALHFVEPYEVQAGRRARGRHCVAFCLTRHEKFVPCSIKK